MSIFPPPWCSQPIRIAVLLVLILLRTNESGAFDLMTGDYCSLTGSIDKES